MAFNSLDISTSRSGGRAELVSQHVSAEVEGGEGSISAACASSVHANNAYLSSEQQHQQAKDSPHYYHPHPAYLHHHHHHHEGSLHLLPPPHHLIPSHSLVYPPLPPLNVPPTPSHRHVPSSPLPFVGIPSLLPMVVNADGSKKSSPIGSNVQREHIKSKALQHGESKKSNNPLNDSNLADKGNHSSSPPSSSKTFTSSPPLQSTNVILKDVAIKGINQHSGTPNSVAATANIASGSYTESTSVPFPPNPPPLATTYCYPYPIAYYPPPPPPYGYHHPIYCHPPPYAHAPPPPPPPPLSMAPETATPPLPPKHASSEAHSSVGATTGKATIESYQHYGSIPSVSADLSIDEKQPPLSTIFGEGYNSENVIISNDITFEDDIMEDDDILNIISRSQHTHTNKSTNNILSICETMSSSSLLTAKQKARIQNIKEKPSEDRTEEEIKLIQSFEQRRRRKNERSRERTKENRVEMNRIMQLPEHQRSSDERQWLNTYMRAKRRKNRKDRERRQRIRMMKQGGVISASISEGDEGLTSSSAHGIESGISSYLSQWRKFQHESDDGEPISCIESADTNTSSGSNTYTKAGIFGTSNDITGNVTTNKPNVMQDCSDDNFDSMICPNMFLHFASVIESPQISQHSKDSPSSLIQYKDQHNTNNAISMRQFSSNDGQISNIFDNPSSPVRTSLQKSSRSSIFRLKPSSGSGS